MQLLASARWFSPETGPLAVGLPLRLGGGEVLAEGSGSVTLPGYKCTSCRTLLLRY